MTSVIREIHQRGTRQMEARSDEARRALVLHDRPLVVDLIELTLNHGVFVVRAAHNLAEADAILATWHPHLAVVDMDHDDSTALLQRLGASNTLTRSVTPVLGLDAPRRPQDEAARLRPRRRRHPDRAVLARGAAGPLDRHHPPRVRHRSADHPDHHDRRDGDRHPQSRGPRRHIGRPPERHRAEPALPAGESRRAGS